MITQQKQSTNSNATNTPGRELAFAREQLSLSLEEISRRTKIGMIYLRAIEGDEIHKLPGRFYARGFLRAYAHEVHCDAEEIVRRFGQAEECDPPEEKMDDVPHLPAPVELDDRRMARLIQLIVIALLVSGGFYLISGKPLRLSLPSRPVPQNPVVTDTKPTSAGVVVATSGETIQPPPEAPKSAEPAVPLSIEVHATNECWLTATADGQRVIYRMLGSGENAKIEAHEDIVLRVGDAAALSYAINGAAGRELGAAGDPVTIHVTATNYREFLNSRPSADGRKGET